MRAVQMGLDQDRMKTGPRSGAHPLQAVVLGSLGMVSGSVFLLNRPIEANHFVDRLRVVSPDLELLLQTLAVEHGLSARSRKLFKKLRGQHISGQTEGYDSVLLDDRRKGL